MSDFSKFQSETTDFAYRVDSLIQNFFETVYRPARLKYGPAIRDPLLPAFLFGRPIILFESKESQELEKQYWQMKFDELERQFENWNECF